MNEERKKLIEKMEAQYAAMRKMIKTAEMEWNDMVNQNPLYRGGDKVRAAYTKGVVTGFRWAGDQYEYFLICEQAAGHLDDMRGPYREEMLTPGW